MIITIEKRVLSLRDTGYIFKVNEKKYTISQHIFELLKQQYYQTPRKERYEEIDEVTGMKYTYNLNSTKWATINPHFKAFKEQVRTLKEQGFTTEQIKQKINRM